MPWKSADHKYGSACYIDGEDFNAMYIGDAARAARDWCVRAKRAEEIQLKRGWCVERWSGGKWHLTEYSCEDSFHADWNENGFDTPNDCLIANDEWLVAYEAEGL